MQTCTYSSHDNVEWQDYYESWASLLALRGKLKAELEKDKQRPLAVVASQEQRFTSQVEQAVRFGKALVVLDVDDVEPMLVPPSTRSRGRELRGPA